MRASILGAAIAVGLGASGGGVRLVRAEDDAGDYPPDHPLKREPRTGRDRTVLREWETRKKRDALYAKSQEQVDG